MIGSAKRVTHGTMSVPAAMLCAASNMSSWPLCHHGVPVLAASAEEAACGRDSRKWKAARQTEWQLLVLGHRLLCGDVGS